MNVSDKEWVPNKYYMSHGIKSWGSEAQYVCDTQPCQKFLAGITFVEIQQA